MKNKLFRASSRIALLLASFSLLLGSARATTLLSLPFDEGTGIYVNDTAQGLLGTFGPIGADPAFDTVALTNDSPSGLPGDRSFVNNRGGFLLADDSATGSLNITNGPITMEGWIKVNSKVRQQNEGIAAYGNSFKLGLRNRILTFTLFGIADIATPDTNAFPVDTWVHVATSWSPGIGVDFYITPTNGVTWHGFRAHAALAARPIHNNNLAVGSEGYAVPLVGSFDRIKVHHRVLIDTDIDNIATSPKANYAETLAAYNFDEAALPSINTVSGAPALPLNYGNTVSAAVFAPVWTNDTPTGLSNDFALAFNLNIPTNRQRVNLDFTSSQVNLGANNTNYTLEAWVKLPTNDPITNRMVFMRTSGNAPRVSFSINTDRKIWTTIAGNTDFKSNITFPSDLAWHHLAVVVTNYAQVHFYLDGVLQQTMNRTAAAVPSTTGITNLLMGMEADNTYFKGILDRVRISNTALVASELDSVAIPAPDLVIQSTGGGNFVITWPTSFSGYVLESSDTLPATSWTNEPYVVDGSENKATISGATSNRFYRLRK